MKFPLIVVNFKLYESASGEAAVVLAKLHDEVAREHGASLAVCVSALDVQRVASSVSLPVFVQHVDACDYGAFTGFIAPKAAKAAGAFGTLLNHAEHRLTDEQLRLTLVKCREADLFTIVCAESIDRVKVILSFEPDLIALEPPELIGGDVSVSTARPELIQEAVAVLPPSRLLVGAGVKNDSDVATCLRLGACGVLLASGVTKAQDPKAVLNDLVKGFSV